MHTLELTDDELRIVRAALTSYLEDFGHDEADVLRLAKRIIAKLPFTTRTVVPIASNTKLFTATAVGLLVEEGKLDWDKPVRQYVPGIQFYDDQLGATVTIRDMLSHRTGITRHDSIRSRTTASHSPSGAIPSSCTASRTTARRREWAPRAP